MLESFPGFETRDPRVNREILAANFEIRRFECRDEERAFVARANWVDTKYMRITSAYCSTTTCIDYHPAPVVRMFVQADAATRIDFHFDGSTVALTNETPTAIIPAGTPFRGVGRQQHAVIALRIDLQGLRTVASAMLAENVSLKHIEAERWAKEGLSKVMCSAAMRLVRDIDSGLPADSPAFDHIAQGFLLRLLLDGSESFGNRLRLEVASPSLEQLRRVEAFMAANWQRDIDVEEIADEFGISGRSIFRYFRSLRGLTPMEFIKDIRLARAREMLSAPDPTDGVMTIGLRCGFQGLGHFARSYRTAFGELPSETLLRARAARAGDE